MLLGGGHRLFYKHLDDRGLEGGGDVAENRELRIGN